MLFDLNCAICETELAQVAHQGDAGIGQHICFTLSVLWFESCYRYFLKNKVPYAETYLSIILQ